MLRAGARSAAGERVAVMENMVVRRLAVSSSVRLDGWRAIIKRLSNPRLFNCVTPSMPANGKLGKL